MSKDLVKKKEGGSLSNLFYLSRLDDVFRKFDNLFDEMWGNWGLDMKVFEDLQPKGGFPKMNVIEHDDNYQIEIAVAGFNKEDVELELKDNTLFVKADKEEVCEGDECKKYLRREIASRSFRRVVRFPAEVDTSNIDCSYKDGIITCRINKIQTEEPKSVKIEIR